MKILKYKLDDIVLEPDIIPDLTFFLLENDVLHFKVQ